MKRKKISKQNSKRPLNIGAGGNTVNSKFPNTRRSAMAKDVGPKPNVQTLGFNGSMVTK